MDLSVFYKDNTGFRTFDTSHICTMLFMLVTAIVLIRTARRSWSPEKQYRVAMVQAWLLCIAAAGYVIARIAQGLFDTKVNLPLDICNILSMLMPALVYSRSKLFFNIAYFLVMAGTTQALLTPNLYDAFPHYTFIKYFIVHGGLVIMMMYMILVLGFRPTFKGLLSAFAAIQCYVVFLLTVNYLLGANYAYLCHKPDTPSLLDYFGPHPWYLLVSEGVAVIFFLIAYSPFYFSAKSKR